MDSARLHIDSLIARARPIAAVLATEHAGTPAELRFDTLTRNLDRFVAALQTTPADASAIAYALSNTWGPKSEPDPGSEEARLAALLVDLVHAVAEWRRSFTPPTGTTFFELNPSRPTPRGPDVSYECLTCGDVIPSVEVANGPWHCRCYAVALDFDAFQASFRDPGNARGLRISAAPIFEDLEEKDNPRNGTPVRDTASVRGLLRERFQGGPSAFWLQYADGTDLTVGVHPPLACVQFTDREAIAHVALPASSTYRDGYFEISVGGTATPLERRLFMPLAEVEPIVAYFVAMGRMDPAAKWEAV